MAFTSQPLDAPMIAAESATSTPEYRVVTKEEYLAGISGAQALAYANDEKPTTRTEVEARVREYFHDIPIMIEVAWCESKFTHYGKDGKTLRGIVRSDLGVMQVNEYYHGETAEKLGLDLLEFEDNMAYARYLYEKQGTQPWYPSAHCWRDGGAPGAHLAKN